MRLKPNKEQLGFTIIELLIATTVFSVLLVGVLASFVKISDLFYKGVSMSKTQEDARNIVQSITDDIQFTSSNVDNMRADHSQFVYNGSSPSGYAQQGAFCVGNHKYSFQIGKQVDSTTYGLGRDTIAGGCDTNASPSPAVNMLDAGMQLNELIVNCSGGSTGRCNVKIHVIFYGVDHTGQFYSQCTNDPMPDCPNSANYLSDQSLAPDARCTGSIQSTDLCAAVDYDSTVLENPHS